MKNRNTYLYVMIALFSMLSPVLFAQNFPAITASFGSSGMEEGRDIISINDEELLIVGTTSGTESNGADVLVMKMDTALNCIWSAHFGGPGVDRGYDALALSDGHFLITGFTSSYGSAGYDVYVFKIDTDGHLIWQTHVGTSDWDFGYRACETLAGYCIVGSSYGSASGLEEAWMCYVSSDGEYLGDVWMGDENATSKIKDVEPVGIDEMFVIGESAPSIYPDSTYMWVKRVGITGDVVWNRTVDYDHYSVSASAIDIRDDLIVACGKRDSSDRGLGVIRKYSFEGDEIDVLLSMQNGKYGYNDIKFYNDSLVNFADLNYAGAGMRDGGIHIYTIYGGFVNGITTGGTQNEYCYAGCVLSDGKIFGVGYAESFEVDEGQLMLVKLGGISSAAYIPSYEASNGCIATEISSVGNEEVPEWVEGYSVLGKKLYEGKTRPIESFQLKGLIIEYHYYRSGEVKLVKWLNCD